MARFTNQAQLRYGRSIANSNIAVGEILLQGRQCGILTDKTIRSPM